DYNQIWLEDDSFDLSALEKAVFRVLREAPDAYVILNIYVCPTARWLKENPGELQLAADGNPVIMRSCAVTTRSSALFPEKRGESWTASIHSEKYRRDLAAVLEKLFREFEKTDAAKAVAGVYVTGGDDAQFRAPPGPDMSPLTRPAFQDFLRKKYGTLENLSAAWKQNIASWQDIRVPTKEQIESPRKVVYSETGPSPESDYKEFVSHDCMKLKTAFRAGVKKGAPRLLVGGYDNAMALPGSSFYGRGRSNMAEIIQDPYCDFLLSLPAYGRERDECLFPIGLKAYTGSMRLHKKLVITELDIRNPKQPPLVERNYRSHNWQATHDYRTFGEILKLCAGYSAAWGGMFHACVMGRFWYDTPEAMAAWKQAADIIAEAPGEKLDDDRIAWICGEKFCNFFCQNGNAEQVSETWSRNVSHALWLSQTRFDAYLPGDLWHPDFKAPKIMLMTCLASMPPEELKKIRSTFLKDGRFLIWLGAPSVFSDAGLDDVATAVGFRLSRPEEIRKRTIFVTGEQHPILKDVTGFLYNPRENASLVHFGNVAITPQAGDQVLAMYQGTHHPGMVLHKTKDGTEIFIGQPGAVTPRLLRNIAETAGIRPVSERNDLMFRGGGLIVIGASDGNGIRRIYYPEGVKALKCLTGQKVTRYGDNFLDVILKYGECAVFKHN
ncbi:MAG: beta-galactosidase, partial [Victivallales bacterium]|nr:beta-galactosidase [Victivallales bacterium]